LPSALRSGAKRREKNSTLLRSSFINILKNFAFAITVKEEVIAEINAPNHAL